MSKLSNKIEAHDRSITEVLDDKKYTVDYFQREFKWEERHIEQLVVGEEVRLNIVKFIWTVNKQDEVICYC